MNAEMNEEEQQIKWYLVLEQIWVTPRNVERTRFPQDQPLTPSRGDEEKKRVEKEKRRA